MIEISTELKFEILEILKREDHFLKNSSNKDLLPFLSEIWDLDNMPSIYEGSTEDESALDEMTRSSSDSMYWDFKALYIDRLQLHESGSPFVLFLETLLSPKYKQQEDEITKLVLLINPLLEKERFKLIITGYDENSIPLYTVRQNKYAPADSPKNTIPFFVVKEPSGFASFQNSHKKPTVFPSFVLNFNDGWNDYGTKSIFYLFYYDLDEVCYSFGAVKIIKGEKGNSANQIDDSFTSLDETFCSLGQSSSYYRELKNVLGRNFENILSALNDVAFYPELEERFERLSNFQHSLIRNNEAERLLRKAKFEIYGVNLTDLYNFTYDFQPIYSRASTPPTKITFEFANQNEFASNRIYALIGKNGVGKTQFMASLPMSIANKEIDKFHPRVPVFSKVISVSYSAFDKFEIPKKNASFNYLHCGLRDEKGDELSERTLLSRFHRTWKQIFKVERMLTWKSILLNFIDEDIVNQFIITKQRELHFDLKGFNKVKQQLSSGQSILLYMISEIVANIRFDTLLLYDEPETHLHPNAISQLMNVIYELVEQFQSYCIIATHSPLVIRELLSRNVYVMERHDTILSIRKTGIETFGENLSTLTDEVFGNKDVTKQYSKIIRELVSSGSSYEQITTQLRSDGIPLNLNTRILISSLMQNEEN